MPRKIRKLSVEEKQKRRLIHLLKNKINLVEFVSQQSKINVERSKLETTEHRDLETVASDAFVSDGKETNASETHTPETNASETDTPETSDSEYGKNGQSTSRKDYLRARQRVYSRRWREKPENKVKIRQYKKKVRQKRREIKIMAKIEKAKLTAQTKMENAKRRAQMKLERARHKAKINNNKIENTT